MHQLLNINNELHEKWRKIMFRTCVIIGIIIFIAEIFIFIFNKTQPDLFASHHPLSLALSGTAIGVEPNFYFRGVFYAKNRKNQ